MEYNCPHWQRVKEHLSSAKSSAQDVIDLTAICSNLSPLPVDVAKISMVDPVKPQIFMENIVRNLLDQNVSLRYSTWNIIKYVYDMVEADASPTNLKLLEILLVVSKADINEYFDAYHKFFGTSRPSATAISFYDSHLLSIGTLRTLNKFATLHAVAIQPVREDIVFAIKHFLVRPAIMAAFQAALQKAGILKDVDWITTTINTMTISFIPSMEADPGFSFNGFTMRDGILLVTDEERLKTILVDHKANMYTAKYKAGILTTCCHVTCDFLMRSAENDFNFAIRKGDAPVMDEVIAGKRLDLGRHVELLLFGDVQPNWATSSMQAAIEFLDKANTQPFYPLISQKPAGEHLYNRLVPSVSMAADLKDMEFEGMC